MVAGARVCQAERVSSEVNRLMWDERAPAHAASPEYGLARFAGDPHHLSDVVRFDGRRLGDISGLRGVHLQCHIGTDTVSLSRLGARMSGLDFSAAAITVARRPGGEREAPTSTSTSPTSTTRSRSSAPAATTWSSPASGRSAGCPTWTAGPGWSPTCSDPVAGCSCAKDIRCCGRWPTRGPTGWWWSSIPTSPRPSRRSGTSRAPTSPPRWQFVHTVSHEWSHGLGEVVTALLDAGMVITGLVEHDSVPWNARPGEMEETRRRVADARPARALPVHLHPAGPQAVRRADAH